MDAFKNSHDNFKTFCAFREMFPTCSQVFDPKNMARDIADMHQPIPITTRKHGWGPYFDFQVHDLYGKPNVVHYCIKLPGDFTLYLDHLLMTTPEIKPFIYLCCTFLRRSALRDLMLDRYAFLTIDTCDVEAGKTQRTPGWHIDCVQGDEVPVKKPGNIAFSWCDMLPTEYAYQTFNMEGIDLSKHNIFDWCARQVKAENIKTINPGAITLMNTYCLHRCKVATEFTKRRYVRLSFTHVPITNTIMTLNPDIPYDYPVHTTDGQIPKHLI